VGGVLLHISLVDGWLHAVLVIGATVSLGGLLLLRRTRAWWTRRVPLAVVLAVVLVIVLRAVVERLKSWPDGLPLTVLGWAGVGVLGLVLLGLGWTRQRWRVRGPAVAAAVLLVLGAVDGIDTVYGAFPSVAAALQLPPADTAGAGSVLFHHPGTTPSAPDGRLWRTWHAPADLPAHGSVAQIAIPPVTSRFPARSAWVYVPPAYLTPKPPVLPVLVLLGGQPGSPRDWLDAGQLSGRMDAWAAAHAGLAPIVVMPDALGGETANPLCMDSALGRADTYLAHDVPAWVGRTLPADPPGHDWAVAGFSYGGTCSLQLAVAHPALFRTFVDISGQRSPTLGGRTQTIAATFGGDESAFAAVDPLHELAAHRYPGISGLFVVGASDRAYGPAQRIVSDAARTAGMTVVTRELPGAHNWMLAGTAFEAALPWIAAHLGLAP
jgi:S-formylglutathione hydrolase FrmB